MWVGGGRRLRVEGAVEQRDPLRDEGVDASPRPSRRVEPALRPPPRRRRARRRGPRSPGPAAAAAARRRARPRCGRRRRRRAAAARRAFRSRARSAPRPRRPRAPGSGRRPPAASPANSNCTNPKSLVRAGSATRFSRPECSVAARAAGAAGRRLLLLPVGQRVLRGLRSALRGFRSRRAGRSGAATGPASAARPHCWPNGAAERVVADVDVVVVVGQREARFRRAGPRARSPGAGCIVPCRLQHVVDQLVGQRARALVAGDRDAVDRRRCRPRRRSMCSETLPEVVMQAVAALERGDRQLEALRDQVLEQRQHAAVDLAGGDVGRGRIRRSRGSCRRGRAAAAPPWRAAGRRRRSSSLAERVLALGAVDRRRLEQLPAVEDRLRVDPRRAAAGRPDREVDVGVDALRRRRRSGRARSRLSPSTRP